ncbi:tyrosine-type recombinase/integrase [Arthrobacter sp. GCM10027362]|uniref:tyrosine-type recombinase/integrase n=1 Tax=Arthrobacter sp. GCM10027362 TaxID=3273379 RepID=UPI003637F962
MLTCPGMPGRSLSAASWPNRGKDRSTGRPTRRRSLGTGSSRYRGLPSRCCCGAAWPPAGTEAVLWSPTGGYLQASSIRRSLRSALTAAGVEVQITPHAFRRTAAAMLARELSDGAAAALLGHTSVAVTHRSYIERLTEVDDYRELLQQLVGGASRGAGSMPSRGGFRPSPDRRTCRQPAMPTVPRPRRKTSGPAAARPGTRRCSAGPNRTATRRAPRPGGEDGCVRDDLPGRCPSLSLVAAAVRHRVHFRET